MTHSGHPALSSRKSSLARKAGVALLSGVLLVPLLSATVAHAESTPSLPGLPAASSGEAKIPLTLALNPSNRSALRTLAAKANKLTSAQKQEVLDDTAPTDEAHDSTIDILKKAGITITKQDDWSVQILVTKEQAEQLFNVDLAGTGKKVTTDDTPTIPKALSGTVGTVLGLDNTPLLSPSALPGFQPGDLNAANGVNRSGSTGANQTVATVQFAGWDSNDLAQYAKNVNIPLPSVTQISIDSASVSQVSGVGSMEVSLDQEMILAGAPKAAQRVYVAPNSGQGFYDAFNAIANDVPTYKITAASISWGFCESSIDSYTASVLQDAVDRTVLAGATTFASSGDAGGYSCSSVSSPGTTPSVDYPAVLPSVIGVGGTSMQKTSTGYRHSAWGDDYTKNASGGGTSTIVARPAYQNNVGVDGSYRLVPDVSNVADPSTGVYTYIKSAGGNVVFGGTSAASPLTAAQYVSTLSSLGCTTGLGDIHTALYAHTDDFTDVTTGTNLLYPATVGYDEATGLGVPNWGKLVYDLPLSGTCVAPAAASAPPAPVTTPTQPVSTPTPTPTPTKTPTPAPPVVTVKTVLASGQTMTSPNKQYTVTMQADGNLVEKGNGKVLWQTGGKGAKATLLGNSTGALYIQNTAKVIVWNTNTVGSNAALSLTNNGDLTWNSGTKVLWHNSAPGSDWLGKGGVLKSGQYLHTANGKDVLTLQSDGNLVLRYNGTVRWQSKTGGHAGAYLNFQTDGNLVLYSAQKKVLWKTGTGKTATKFVVQTDGNLVVYAGSKAAWSSHSHN